MAVLLQTESRICPSPPTGFQLFNIATPANVTKLLSSKTDRKQADKGREKKQEIAARMICFTLAITNSM